MDTARPSDDDEAVSAIPRLSYTGKDDRVSLSLGDRARGAYGVWAGVVPCSLICE